MTRDTAMMALTVSIGALGFFLAFCVALELLQLLDKVLPAKELSYIEHYSSTLEWDSMSEALDCAGKLVERMVVAGDTLNVTVTYLQRDQ